MHHETLEGGSHFVFFSGTDGCSVRSVPEKLRIVRRHRSNEKCSPEAPDGTPAFANFPIFINVFFFFPLEGAREEAGIEIGLRLGLVPPARREPVPFEVGFRFSSEEACRR